MMPTFFHLQSHLWIAYLFVVNGWLISLCLRHSSSEYRALTEPLEAQVLASFFISIGLNGALMLVLQWLAVDFASLGFILPLITLIAALGLWWKSGGNLTHMLFEFSWVRGVLYLLVFAVLFYNGGLVEQISDAWWHMSLANKIGIENSFTPASGHLTGLPTRYYPPLWHGNLALAQILSGEMLVVLWNSFTAWGAVFKVMAFYLFARALTRQPTTALIAALLFVLLPGIGNSYLRVSAWPSHVAYTAWFGLFYVALRFLDGPRELSRRNAWMSWFSLKQSAMIVTFIVLAAIIYFSHKAELLYFALAFLFYFFALSVARFWGRKDVEVGAVQQLISMTALGLLCVALIFSARLLLAGAQGGELQADQYLMLLLPMIVMLGFLLSGIAGERLPDGFLRVTSLLLLGGLLATIDTRHLASLFNPELAYPMHSSREFPLAAPGWFGMLLKIPGWHLQLREGLLYSGILSLPVSVLLAIWRPSRASLWLAGNCFFALLICLSPYLYHWFSELLGYHSPWRIAILIFHPIVYALVLQHAVELWRGRA